MIAQVHISRNIGRKLDAIDVLRIAAEIHAVRADLPIDEQRKLAGILREVRRLRQEVSR